MSNNLDRLVKGAPPPDVSVPQVQAAAAGTFRSSSPSTSRESSPERAAQEQLIESKRPAAPQSRDSTPSVSDPTYTLPSSPPQIYLNLLILEASLRTQYLTLRARRRQHSFFLVVLTLWIAAFTYLLFFYPREDGQGRGGSPYWIIDTSEKIGWTSGVVTALLFWATGQWERGVRWPRRWMAITNRGLRGMNLKVVVLRRSWWRSFFSSLGFLFPYSSFRPFPGSSFQYVGVSEKRPASTKYMYREGHQMRGLRLEDVAPGGDFIKLLLLPKPFSPEFRENWELYRTEYWEHENERRAQLRQIVRQRQREIAKEQGGWLWWTGWRGWRGRRAQQYPDIPSNLDPSKMLLHNPQLQQQQQHQRQSSTTTRRRRQSTASQQRDLPQHSRSSSRASTGTVEGGDPKTGAVSAGEKERRGHRRTKLSGEIGSVRRSRRSEGLPPIESEQDSLEDAGSGSSGRIDIKSNPLVENVSEEA